MCTVADWRGDYRGLTNLSCDSFRRIEVACRRYKLYSAYRDVDVLLRAPLFLFPKHAEDRQQPLVPGWADFEDQPLLVIAHQRVGLREQGEAGLQLQCI